jgi:hypothetical protein
LRVICLNAYSVLILRAAGKERLGARKVKKEDSNKAILKETGYGNVE